MMGDEHTRRRAQPAPAGEARRPVPRRASPIIDPVRDPVAAARDPVVDSAHDPAIAGRAPTSGFDLLSRMGHELRSPLSAILGFAQILRDGGGGGGGDGQPLPALQAGMVRQIEVSGLTLLAMVNDLVELARMEADRFELASEGVDLVRLLREVCTQVELQAAAGELTLELALPDAPVTVRTDRARLVHLVANLLTHAIRYNRRGGWVGLGLAVADGQARITVSDSGGGLSDETVTALFDPFARTTLDGSSVQGTGIGLLVAQRLALALGGTLALNVTPGAGCDTVVSLPLAEPGKQAAPSAAAPRHRQAQR